MSVRSVSTFTMGERVKPSGSVYPTASACAASGATGISEYCDTVSVQGNSSDYIQSSFKVFVNADEPFHTEKNFIYTNSVDIDGYVYFEKTTVPVYGAVFKADGKVITDKSGNPVSSDNDGHFSFKVNPGTKKLEASKEGHTFMFGGV